MRVGLREHERLRPVGARAVGRPRRRRAGHGVLVSRSNRWPVPPKTIPGCSGVARRVAALSAGADRLPVAHRDLGELAARAHGDGARVLLCAGHPVRQPIVDRAVVDLRRRLVEPRAPRDVARIVGHRVARDDRALVARDDHRVRVVGRDPRLMVVVAARRPAQRHPRLAAVLGSRHRDVRHVDDVGVLRIDDDVLEIPAASPERGIARQLGPRRARVVGAEESALPRRRRRLRTRRIAAAASPTAAAASGRCRRVRIRHEAIHHRVHAPRIARRYRDARLADSLFGQAGRQLLPRRAAVGRLEDAAARAVRRRVRVPRRTSRIPESRVHDLRIRRIDHHLDGTDVLVLVEHLLPRLAAIDRLEDAALGTRRVQMPDRRHEHDVRILRVHRDSADVLRVVEPDVRPCLASVGRLVHAVAEASRVA